MQQIQLPEDGALVTMALRWKWGAHPSFLNPLLGQKGYPYSSAVPTTGEMSLANPVFL